MNVSFVDNASGHQYFSKEYRKVTSPPLISLHEHEFRGEELHGKGGGVREDARYKHAVMNNFSE